MGNGRSSGLKVPAVCLQNIQLGEHWRTLQPSWISRKDETDPRAPIWPHEEPKTERDHSQTHTLGSARAFICTHLDRAASSAVINLQLKRCCLSETCHCSHAQRCSSLKHSSA